LKEGITQWIARAAHDIQACRDSMKSDPKNFWLWINLVRRLAFTDPVSAIQSCTTAITEHGHLSPSMVLMNLYAAQADYSRAIITMLNLHPKLSKGLKEALIPGSDSLVPFGHPSDAENLALEEYYMYKWV
jgi:hypothetical protein